MSSCLPSLPAKAKEFMRAAEKLGFARRCQRGSHARWIHPDGRATTIPIHPSAEIGGWLFHKLLKDLGMTEEEFRRLR
jgi:predicted RNA binding protein YcfA (HicA-like mRNA interferase family)